MIKSVPFPTAGTGHPHNALSLPQAFKPLRLFGMAASYDHRLSQAMQNALSHDEWLTLLVQDEMEERESLALSRRLKRAQFEQDKTFESFDLSRYTSKVQNLVKHMNRKALTSSPILIVGPTGTGKSHLAQAFGHQGCRDGKDVRFVRVTHYLREMYASRADQSWEKVFKRYTQPDILILDDFGLSSFTTVQAEDIYELIAVRHQKNQLIVTSNRKVESWGDLFPDPAMGNAALDRLIDKSVIFLLEGDSYRRPLKESHEVHRQKTQEEEVKK